MKTIDLDGSLWKTEKAKHWWQGFRIESSPRVYQDHSSRDDELSSWTELMNNFIKGRSRWKKNDLSSPHIYFHLDEKFMNFSNELGQMWLLQDLCRGRTPIRLFWLSSSLILLKSINNQPAIRPVRGDPFDWSGSEQRGVQALTVGFLLSFHHNQAALRYAARTWPLPNLLIKLLLRLGKQESEAGDGAILYEADIFDRCSIVSSVRAGESPVGQLVLQWRWLLK